MSLDRPCHDLTATDMEPALSSVAVPRTVSVTNEGKQRYHRQSYAWQKSTAICRTSVCKVNQTFQILLSLQILAIWSFLNTLRYLLSFCSTSHCYTVCQECYSSWILGHRRAEGFFFLCEYRAGVWSPSRAPPTSRKYQIIKLELDSPIIALQGRDPQCRVQKCENICILKPYLDGNCFSRGCQWK